MNPKKKNGNSKKVRDSNRVRRAIGWIVTLMAVMLLAGSLARSGTVRAYLSKIVGHTKNRFDPSVLVGRWQRPDGGYILQISAAHADGRLEAQYFNPQPINVSHAEVRRWDQMSGLFLELRDVNYPGCTYNLAYLPGEDCLEGQYYQAAIQETFDVRFERIKPESSEPVKRQSETNQ